MFAIFSKQIEACFETLACEKRYSKHPFSAILKTIQRYCDSLAATQTVFLQKLQIIFGLLAVHISTRIASPDT